MTSAPTPRAVPACLALLLVGVTGTARPADRRFGLEADIGRDSNVNRAAADKRADEFADIEGYAARSIQTGAKSGVVLRGALRGRQYFTYTDLSNVGLSARAAWRYQPEPSYTGAWFEAALQGEALRYRDSPIRDGSIVSASLSLGKWFSDRFRGVAGAGYDRRYASEGSVYDLSNPKAWASLDWRASDSVTVYGSTTLIGGQQVFTAVTAGGGSGGYGWTGGGYGGSYAVAARDTVFDRNGEQFTAYRVDARTTVLELGLNWAFAGNHALDAGVTRYSAKADNGPTYDGYIARAGWLYRFR
jgi:hypothetical protein